MPVSLQKMIVCRPNAPGDNVTQAPCPLRHRLFAQDSYLFLPDPAGSGAVVKPGWLVDSAGDGAARTFVEWRTLANAASPVPDVDPATAAQFFSTGFFVVLGCYLLGLKFGVVLAMLRGRR